MSTGAKMPLARAEALALAVRDALAPACERIEVAGSIRRRRAEVGDLELVAVPRFIDGPARDLFTPPAKESALDALLDEMTTRGRLGAHPERPAAGARYKRLWMAPGVQVDLFVVLAPAQWGPLFAIRTGSADYARGLVTALWSRGLRCVEGHVVDVRTGVTVDCPSEERFFECAGRAWVPPTERG